MAGEVAKVDPRQLLIGQRGAVRIHSVSEVFQLAAAMVASGIAPKGMTKEAAVGVMMFGMELGLSPIQSLKDICFINGKPCAYGDALSGLINASGLLAAAPEVTYSPNKTSCRVVLRRRGVAAEFIGEYTLEMAKRAGLAGKDVWKNYPERMLFWRAYTYAARDGFSDVLKGLTSREEVEDMGIPTTAEVIPARRVEQIEDIREVQEPLVDAIAKDTLPQGEPVQEVAPVRDATNHFAEWQMVSKVLKPKEVDEIRNRLQVDLIHKHTPAAMLEQAISMAREMTKE